MRDQKRTLVVMTFSFLLVLMPNGISINQTIPIMANEAEPAAIDIMQMIPDPYLETEPYAFVSGTSNEFEYNYNSSHDIMQLNWTHTKGTTLESISDNDEETPCYNDFVFFTQSFEWPYEEMPEKAEGYLNYSVTLTDGFTNSSTHSMFRVYAWFIDSSANWRTIYYSNPPYSSNFQERRTQINYFSLLAGFGGMIEYTPGIQEDPQDILKVGIGLAPTIDFQSSPDNGSVIVEVTSMTLYVVMEAEPDPATHLSPLYNTTFVTESKDIFPAYLGDVIDVRDNFRSMTKDPEGNLYLTGDCITSYELRVEEGLWSTHQFLIKYNPILNRQWLVRNDNLTRGRAITYHDGYIYTTGYFYRDEPDYYNLMLTKWSTDGRKIWEKEWGGSYDQVGVGIGVHSEGSIYVFVSDYNIRSEPSYHNASLMKFDSSGNVIWSKQPEDTATQDLSIDFWVFQDHIVYQQGGGLACMDLEGGWLWGHLSAAATCDENGTIYSAVRDYEGVGIKQYNSDGNETWSAYYQIQYPNGWYEDLVPYDLSLTPTGELLVLVQGQRYDQSYSLLKYDLEGNLLQTWSIGDYTWPLPGQWPPQMEATSTGLVYFTYVPMTSDVWTQGYAVGNYTLPYLGPDILVIVAAGGGVVAIALIGIFVYKRKQV